MDKHYIGSVNDFIVRVKTDREGWPHVWFRGEPGGIDTLLLPKLYRPRKDGTKHNENKLLQTFPLHCQDMKLLSRRSVLACGGSVAVLGSTRRATDPATRLE